MRSGTRAASSRPGIPDERLFEAAAIVGGHPGVSHNYRRSHAFNLWFTLAVEPGARLGLQETIDILAEATGAESMRLLPTLKLFKINVQLDMTGTQDAAAKAAPAAPPVRGDGVLPTDDDKRFICILQRDLPGGAGAVRSSGPRRPASIPDELLEHAQTFVDAVVHAALRGRPEPSARRLRRQRHGGVAGTRGRA